MQFSTSKCAHRARPKTGFALRILSLLSQTVYSGKQWTKRFPRTKNGPEEPILSAGKNSFLHPPL
jgi:hypothetical protein